MSKDILSLIAISLNDRTDFKLSESPDWNDIYEMAKKHNVLSVVYYGINKLPETKKPSAEFLGKLKEKHYLKTKSNILQLLEIERIQNAFEEAGIYSIALKGCNTKKRYPVEMFRSMGDLDILIRPEQNKQVYDIMHNIGYSGYQEGRKHDHYIKNKIGIEMHRMLVPAESEYSDYYSDIWDRTRPIAGKKYTYAMSLEDEYIYNVIHLIQHFKLGGIGIRFIMDIYVYNHFCAMDKTYLNAEFDKLGITEFVENLEHLADGWFGGKRFPEEKRALLNKLSIYIMNGGVFGDAGNAAVLQTKNNSFKYLLNFCFPDYKSMVSLYPWLEGKPFLLPFSWVHRGVKAMIYRRKNIRTVVRTSKGSDKKKYQQLKRFYSECGLNV